MMNINPREVAATTVFEVMEENAYNSLALRQNLKKNNAMPLIDKSLVTEIVNGTLRNMIYIDYVINSVSDTKTQKIKPWILAVLRTAVYQIKFMHKIPNSAACNEAVSLVKKRGYEKLSGFANAVVRNIERTIDDIKFPDEKEDPIGYLEIKYSHPKWVVNMWVKKYGYEFVKELCEKNNSSVDVTIGVNILKTDRKKLIQEFGREGINLKDGIYYKNALKISKTSDISKLESFKNGLFHVQDESSMIAVLILNPKPNDRILDVCAAPGGKSFLMAQLMNNSGEVISRDIHDHKLDLINETADRLGISIIKTENSDGTKFNKESIESFDKVLIDAPCSGLGLIRKKPDIRFKKGGNDIDSLVEIQRDILKTNSSYVKKGGILVYCTCTICNKENMGNINWFINNYDYELVSIKEGENAMDSLNMPTKDKGYIELFPNVHNTDGFFIAHMRRKGR